MREAKEVLSLQMSGTMVEKYCFNHSFDLLFFWVFLPNVCIVTRKEGKKNGRRSNMKNIPKLPILDIYSKKSQHIHFLAHGPSLGPLLVLHIFRSPKAFKMHFLEIKPWTCDHG